MKKKDYIIITLFVVLVAVASSLIYFNNKPENVKIVKEKNIGIGDIVNKKQTTLIYVENTNDKKCTNCSKIKKYLNSKKINYILYDVKSQGNSNYNRLLEILNIDKDIFNYPALIYMQDGVMFANIINIDDTKIVDQFIEDYDLTKVK